MDKDDLIRIKQFLDDIRVVQEFSESGIEDTYLKLTCTPMRKLLIENELSNIWRLVGFNREPTISTSYLDTKLLHDTDTVFIAGARDHNPTIEKKLLTNPTQEEIIANIRPHPLGMIGPAMIVYESNGDKIYQPTDANFAHTTHSNYNIDANLITDNKQVGVSQYKESIVIYWNGQKIQRQHIVAYIAYNLAVLHSKPSLSKLEKEKVTVLDSFTTINLEYRNLVFYTYQSIAQELVSSPQVQELIKKCEALNLSTS